MANEFNEKTAETGSSVKCKDCGANLTFQPGTINLTCEYCGAKNEIQVVKSVVVENDFNKFLSEESSGSAKQEISTVKCDNCGAATTLRPHITSDSCPYCGTALVIKNGTTSTTIKPKYLLPFKIERKAASVEFVNWVSGLWFAPNDLKKYAENSADKLKGVYLPYWTYDSNTNSDYAGARGTHYYVSETYHTTENGKSVTRTRQVRRTRWSSVTGYVSNAFDDILVCSSNSLPREIIKELEPWDLPALINYDDKFLSGFVTECYQINVKDGFAEAKGIMDVVINKSVVRDIGGDEQRVHHINTNYLNISFKHILLPLWISAYRYNDKSYRFMINARTGEVKGERPYSAIKITLFVISVVGVIGGLIYMFAQK